MIYLLLLLSQYPFGQNKVQYENIKWNIIESEHFKLYYQDGSEGMAGFSIQVLESTYVYLRKRLTYRTEGDEEKIPVIIYNSYNKFEETNVILSRLPESVGGFTESFKNRVVVPFDGNWSSLRHVLSHELVHVFQNRIWFGTGLNALNKRLTMNIPLWFIEGMAEFYSLGWNGESDSYMRDLVINQNVIPLTRLEYYGGLVIYKEGQSVLKFIEDRYGIQKIGEIVNAIRVTKSFDRAVEKVLGINIQKLDEMWQRKIKKDYWPLLSEREYVDEIARKVVDHRVKKNYLNYAPSISSDGSRIIYYTDSKGDIEIRAVSPINNRDLGRVVTGGRGRKFESLHILEGHIGVSPTGDTICFTSKEMGRDVLYLYSFKKGRIINRISLKLDRIMWPEFSPDGKRIVLTGVIDGTPDIYLYNLENKDLFNLTNDFYSELNPSFWGDKVLFVSSKPSGNEWDYDKYDLYVIEDGVIKKLLSFDGSVFSPYGRDSLIYFLSERDGSKNLFVYNVNSGRIYQLTRFLESIQGYSIDRNGTSCALSCFVDGAWDIFYMDDLSSFIPTEPLPYREFPEVRFRLIPEKTVNGKRAPVELSIDYLQSYVLYDTYYGLWGEFLLGISDMLGNHQIFAYFNNTDIINSDFEIIYMYLPRRIDYGFSISKYSVGFLSQYGNDLYYNFGTLWGMGTLIRYPFDTFTRFDFYTLSNYLTYDSYRASHDTLFYTGSVSEFGVFGETWLVHDNTLWYGYAPVKGFRGYVKFIFPLVYYENVWDLKSISTDLRWYHYFGNRWSFASRLMLISSWGRDVLHLGGAVGIGDLGWVRGYDYYEQYGTKTGVFSMELRFPFVKKLELGFPPVSISGIMGAIFFDAGGATYSMDEYRIFDFSIGFPRLVDPVASIGFEAKLNLGITDVNFYVAKRTDLATISRETYYSIYLGYAF